MRIALVSQFVPPFIGGIQVHIGRLVEGLQHRGHTVTVVRGALSQNGPGSLLSSLNDALKTYDIVHLHGFERLLFTLVLNRRPSRLIVTPHGGILGPAVLPGPVNYLKRQIDRRFLLPLLQRMAAGVIALNLREAKHLEQNGIRAERISIIPNGLDLHSAPARPSDPYVLFVGRLAAMKRIDLCLRLLQLVSQLDGYFVGPYTVGARRLYENMAGRLGVAARIRFLGPLTGEPLRELQRGAVANLLLSDFEHQPLSVLEAASVGTPSVVRRGCTSEDWSPFGDLVVSVSTMAEARLAVEQMRTLSQADRERLRQSAFSALRDRTWPEIASKIEAVYYLSSYA